MRLVIKTATIYLSLAAPMERMDRPPLAAPLEAPMERAPNIEAATNPHAPTSSWRHTPSCYYVSSASNYPQSSIVGLYQPFWTVAATSMIVMCAQFISVIFPKVMAITLMPIILMVLFNLLSIAHVVSLCVRAGWTSIPSDVFSSIYFSSVFIALNITGGILGCFKSTRMNAHVVLSTLIVLKYICVLIFNMKDPCTNSCCILIGGRGRSDSPDICTIIMLVLWIILIVATIPCSLIEIIMNWDDQNRGVFIGESASIVLFIPLAALFFSNVLQKVPFVALGFLAIFILLKTVQIFYAVGNSIKLASSRGFKVSGLGPPSSDAMPDPSQAFYGLNGYDF